MTPALPSFWDAIYDDLRRSLGLNPTNTYNPAAANPFGLNPGTSGLSSEYFKTDEGRAALWNALARNFALTDPVKARLLPALFNQVDTRYKAAAAIDKNLMPDQFFANLDTNRLIHELTPQQRGENPRNFTRGFRTLQA